MYRNVLAEMRRLSLRQIDVACKLDMSPSTLSQKLTGKSEFNLSEAIAVKKLLQTNMPLDELFDYQ